ncbi:hypothetical protein [Ornithobacterium rhinotracheale]|uniref:hypothetical protein n=1 Tax=Ornithobacterium rhinotracheale TaxID=28251 RepID=UPI0040368960
MDKQSKYTYCKETTEEHSIARECGDCVQKIVEVCVNEGARNVPSTYDNNCLNLDKYEEYKAIRERRDKQKTMDLCIGVKCRDKRGMLLIELKLKYKNPNNLVGKELLDKIKNSKNILGHTPMILDRYYFIFKRDIKEQAYNRLKRLFNNKKNFFVIDLEQLEQEYFV